MATGAEAKTDQASDAGDLARQLGSYLLRHTASVLALSAVVLYGIGLLRRLGQLNADHLDAARALPLSPLQSYLLSGLSVVLSTTFVLLLVVAAGAVVFAERLIGSGSERLKGGEDSGQAWRLKKLEPIFHLALLMAIVVLLPVRYWLPVVVLGAALVAGYMALASRGILPESAEDLSPSQLRVAGVAIAALLIGTFAIQGYFNPPPLDSVKIRTDSGRVIDGKLLTQDGGFVYLAKVDTRPRHESSILAVSTSQVETMHISEGEPRLFKTLPEALGVRFWRLELNSDRPLLQRSP